MLPGLMNFIMYCVDTYLTDYKLYGGSLLKYSVNKGAMWYLKYMEGILHQALSIAPFSAPATYEETKLWPRALSATAIIWAKAGC